MLNKNAFIWSKIYCEILQIKSAVSNFNIFWNVIYICDSKAEFSVFSVIIETFLFQCHITFLIIVNDDSSAAFM